MRLRLTDLIDRVMAADTVADDIVVIEVRRHPAIGCVAVIAGVAARDVILRFAVDDGIVVAARTGAKDLQVIYAHDGQECDGRMAVFADTRRCYVLQIFTGRADPIVTTDAAPDHVAVIERHRKPCGSLVAGIALLLS